MQRACLSVHSQYFPPASQPAPRQPSRQQESQLGAKKRGEPPTHCHTSRASSPPGAEQKVHTLQSERSLHAAQQSAGESSTFLSPVSTVAVPACTAGGCCSGRSKIQGGQGCEQGCAIHERQHPQGRQRCGGKSNSGGGWRALALTTADRRQAPHLLSSPPRLSPLAALHCLQGVGCRPVVSSGDSIRQPRLGSVLSSPAAYSNEHNARRRGGGSCRSASCEEHDGKPDCQWAWLWSHGGVLPIPWGPDSVTAKGVGSTQEEGVAQHLEASDSCQSDVASACTWRFVL